MKNDTFLLLTGSCKEVGLLKNQELLYNVLEQLPKIINMNTIRKPIISVAKNNPGLEGYVPIDASNITISTYTDSLRIVACIHSCNNFDYKRVIDYLENEYRCNIKSLYCHESDFKDSNQQT